MPGFQLFLGSVHHLVLVKLATSSRKVNVRFISVHLLIKYPLNQRGYFRAFAIYVNSVAWKFSGSFENPINFEARGSSESLNCQC